MSRNPTSPGKSTLHALLQAHLKEAVDRLLRTQVHPWAMMTAGPFRINDFYGKQIHYEGIRFEGSPCDVFWGGYIEPFLRRLVQDQIANARELAVDRGVATREVLLDLQAQLRVAVAGVYQVMAGIDQRLRGRGFPDSVPLRRVDSQVDDMSQFVDRLIEAELASQPKSSSRLTRIYDAQKFWFWAIGLLVAVVLGVLKLFI